MMFLQWAVPGALIPLYTVRPEQELGVGWLLGRGLRDPLHLGAVVAFLLAGYSLTLPHTPPRRPADPGRALAPVAAFRLLRVPSVAVYCACVLGACMTFPFTTQNTPLL